MYSITPHCNTVNSFLFIRGLIFSSRITSGKSSSDHVDVRSHARSHGRAHIAKHNGQDRHPINQKTEADDESEHLA